MSELSIARRYAKALSEEAAQAGVTEQVDADIDMIRATLEGSRELMLFFGSPVISRKKKASVVDTLFGSKVEATTRSFLQLLIEKRRETLFAAVVQAYRELRDEQLGITEAKARVALPLSAEEERSLVQSLEQMTGQRIRLQVEHDPALIGGLVVRVDDTVYDGSVRHKLASLRERMEAGNFSVN